MNTTRYTHRCCLLDPHSCLLPWKYWAYLMSCTCVRARQPQRCQSGLSPLEGFHTNDTYSTTHFLLWEVHMQETPTPSPTILRKGWQLFWLWGKPAMHLRTRRVGSCMSPWVMDGFLLHCMVLYIHKVHWQQAKWSLKTSSLNPSRQACWIVTAPGASLQVSSLKSEGVFFQKNIINWS